MKNIGSFFLSGAKNSACFMEVRGLILKGEKTYDESY